MSWCRLSILGIRWIVFVGCFGFVAWGWFNSGKKFLSDQTSVSIVINESNKFHYPSITFCRKFKGGVNLAKVLVDEAERQGLESIEHLDLDEIVANISYDRRDFLSIFSHPPFGHPGTSQWILTNDTFWTITIPHPQASGSCSTYDPPFDSWASAWFGIRFGFRFRDLEPLGLSPEAKDNVMQDIDMFMHTKGNFMFYKQDDRPSSIKFDLSSVRYQHETSINPSFGFFTKLSTQSRPCTADEHQSFLQCVEKFYAQRRGCQYPWFYFDDFGIPKCSKVTELKEKVNEGEYGSLEAEDWNRPWSATSELAKKTGCPVPCTTAKLKTALSFRDIRSWMSYMDGGAEWVAWIWFKNFQIRYDQEYVVCDWTCLIGELGGNLGFFLGGSILTYVDVLIDPVNKYFQHKKRP